MLSVDENEMLTKVDAGTPVGELMRRYWHPVATSQEIKENPVKAVRLLGESLTLFQDRQGRLGLIDQRCAHRRVDLKYGIPENEGLRCPYHGWLYDRTGQCLEQPAETQKTTFKNTVKLKAYSVQELGGLVWAYIGPQPAPLLPRWDLFVLDGVFRQIGTTLLPCNWLQCQENAVDTVHTSYAHGLFGLYAIERRGITDPRKIKSFQRISRPHKEIAFDYVPFGIQKRRLVVGDSEDNERWRIGHPMIFPNYVRIGQPGYAEFQIRVPMDDTHTWHLGYQVFFPGPDVDVPKQDPVPAYEVPIQDLPDFVLGQDLLCWVAQGEILDRSKERLGESDRGLVMFRNMLKEQIKIVQEGGDPMNTFRDPAKNERIDVSMEDRGGVDAYEKGGVRYMNQGTYSTVLDQLDDLMTKGAEAARRARQ
jgi:5,5'-dehydrodivanillate O-demethylase oxygenase subunit